MLERYQIKQEISHKAGRSTYVAHDSETNEQVVIKILEFNDLFSWGDFKLFEREGKILQNLSHPNIPNYLDYFEINESNRQGFALVQTYIDAPSLAELINRGIKFSETEIIELAEKLLSILNYLHRLNPPVIHRDIKPSNILLTNRSGNSIGDVYLVDFGSGQTVAKKEAGSITIVGSYGYIPLEQFMGQTTFASDLYSLGMTLIYLVTGIHPGELTQVKGRVQFDNSEISRNFSLWLAKITDSYVENRYQSANIALTALQSGDNNNGNFLHLRPQNSQINLYRDRTNLIITYPTKTIIESCTWYEWWISFVVGNLLTIFLISISEFLTFDGYFLILIPILVLNGIVTTRINCLLREKGSSFAVFSMTKKDNNIIPEIRIKKGIYFQKDIIPNLIDLLQMPKNANHLEHLENIPQKINWDNSYDNKKHSNSYYNGKINNIIYSPPYSFNERICDFQLDKEGAIYPFSNKLAWEYRWSRIYTWRAIQEYKKFIFIGMLADDHVSPSTVVDRVWHLHLTYTYSYWQEFCGEVLGKPYHHFPSLGGEKEGYRYRNNYERTLKFYYYYFGQPPADIWNEPKLSGEKVSCQWVDREHYWLIPKNIISLKSIFSVINKQI